MSTSLRVALLGVALVVPGSLAAQDSTSRAVVQPLPSPEVQRLNRALMELARRPERLSALLEAGDASLEVGDFDAAIGFYGRAADVAPSDPRVSLGLGRGYLRSGRPLEAIPMFNAAQSGGTPARDLLSDQALAFDLIGDQSSAQAAYARAIELNPDDAEARRRLGLSQAISGNQAGFMGTLAPLIEGGDAGAIRARAFGLAILGQQERAEAIVNASMPRDLAARINPYLAYMPRLTAAQQAAAANLGIFPRAADIGREDPRLARFAREGAAGSRLEPAGEPLGTRPAQTVQAAPAAPAQTVQREVAQAAPPPAPRVADAFADLGTGAMPDTSASGDVVDIASIDVPREAAPAPEPAPPAHPQRIWVQLATGREVNALKFDWRRFARQAPELLRDFKPHTTPWGQANRLLAGPLTNRDAARELVNALAEKGIDTFAYTSPEGTEIQELK
ncbi:MAG: SPOR domain-containing protein [Erythrobacteraceae bacterium]|nr:SPOR domain-containing protein [Erythrobacteraceae bacterium]